MVGWQKCEAFFGSTKKAQSVTSQWLVALTTFVLQLWFFLFFFCISVSPLSLSLSLSLSQSLSVSLHSSSSSSSSSFSSSSSSSSSSSLEGVWPHIDGESEGRAGLVAALVAEQRVNRHHLQVQRVLSGPRHGAGQHQHGADVIDLLEKTKQMSLSTFTQQILINTTHMCLQWRPSV